MDSLSIDAPTYAQPDDVAVVLHTSGTTSQPKSVPLTHINICATAEHARVAMALEEHDRYLNVIPLFHVAGLMSGVITSLMAGASVVCASDFEPSQFFECLAAFRPTWYMGVSVIHQAILAHAPQYLDIIDRCPFRFIRSPAAPLAAKVIAELERTFNAPMIRSYGVTEATLICCNPLPPRQRKPDSVGVPAGPDVAIMDAEGGLLAGGETGEIVIRGPNVMAGYENSPEVNREVFRDGWFRTGDQGFFDADGYLFITGRFKELINRGGESLAPQEVDNVFMEYPGVAQAVTFAVPHVRWEEDVVTAVVMHPNASATEQELRRFAATRLASFKVPSQVLFVESIPVGYTGKPQRNRLAEQFGLVVPSQEQGGFHMDYTPPRTPLEKRLAELWSTTLGIERVGIDDNFFQLGGDSLLATQLLPRLRDEAHVEVSFRQFFDTPTIADIAEYIASVQQGMPQLSAPSLQPIPHDGPLPLSYAQQRMWFLDQLGLSRHAYNILDAIHIDGCLQVEALEQSFQEIIRRHEVLRTTFTTVDGQPLQVIGPASHLDMPIVDLRRCSPREQDTQVHLLAQNEVQQSFDLERGPLLRTVLIQLADTEHMFLLTLHHIVSDGWSHGVFWQELALLYESYASGQRSPLPALNIQYADFAHWQQQWMQGEVLNTLLDYWKQQLAGVSVLQLPTDHPRPAMQSFRGARHYLNLSLTLTQKLKVLSQQRGVTLFMSLLAAFQTLLHRYTGQDDIAVGSLIANRNRIEIEPLIGFFVNTLLLRTHLSGNPRFGELLMRVRDTTLDAYEHQDLPYEKLLEELRPPRDLSRNPMFQVMFVLHNAPREIPEFPALTVDPLEVDPGTARFDLMLEFWETSEGLLSRFEYSTDLFEPTTIVRMAGHLQTLLEGIVVEPDQHISHLPLLTDEERHRLLIEWNDTTLAYPDQHCIQDVFEAQVARTPEAVAVVCEDVLLTYHELNCRANQIAHYLLALGVETETLVGICIERSLDMVVGLMGILKAGASYLPLDPTYPKERLAFMIEDALPAVVLTQERFVGSLPTQNIQVVCLDSSPSSITQFSDYNPKRNTTADNLAYLLYTSGSTGRPKGVQGVHRAVMNALAWMWQTYPFATDETCCQKTSISFGDSIQEWLGPLLQGIRMVLIPDDVLRDLPQFIQTLAQHSVTRLILVPSLLRTLLDTFPDLQEHLPNLKLWFTGGEALSADLCQLFRDRLPQSCLVNLYGTSEAADDTTYFDITASDSELSPVPIGRPIANTQLYVLDQYLQLVPIGVPGELYVGGSSLTRGYLNHPDLTAEKFIPHPFSDQPDARLYKTGDIVRYRTDSNVEYIGRSDHQVKLHGVRMELGEIEIRLSQHPDVHQTVVIVREDVPGEPRLTAYIVPTELPGPPIGELRHFLEKQLPMAMIPSAFVMLETLPQTPSGKVDRQALPQPTPLRPNLEERYIAPRNALEEQVATIWQELLGSDRIGIYDNFFELGGHSLLAMKLLFRVQDTTRIEVPLLRFFEAPTVLGMTTIIGAVNQTVQGQHSPVIVPTSRDDVLLASIAQEHFWLFDQLLPGQPLFNIPYVVRLQGELNVTILEQSFKEMIQRHEILRTTFGREGGQLVQVIVPNLPLSLTVHDLYALPEDEREGIAQQLVQEEGQRPFDLQQGPLLRACLIRLKDQEHILLVTLHHIICDGWSLGVFMKELAVLYDALVAGDKPTLPVLPIQYVDFACWQRQWRHHKAMKDQLAYWQTQLREPLITLNLPTDRPRGAGLTWHTARQTFEIPKTLFESLRNLSRREDCTLFMTFLVAFKILLYGYTGQEDLRVATLVANRTRRETANLIGLLANTAILRTDLSNNPSAREVLQRVRTTILEASAHQELPFEEVVRTLEQDRDFERTSLSQVLVIWQNTMVQIQQFPQQVLRFETIEQNAELPGAAITTFDIVLTLRERSEGLTGTVVYKTDLFDAATISRMLDDFQYVLEGFSTSLEQTLSIFRSLRNVRG
jgi:amino acid adenylation domain-containing protein